MLLEKEVKFYGVVCNKNDINVSKIKSIDDGSFIASAIA